jgi:uncharacterized membrane protein
LELLTFVIRRLAFGNHPSSIIHHQSPVFRLTLERGYSVPTMLGVAAAAILLAGIFYWRAFRTLRRGQWQTLLALRVLAILVIIMLLFRPVFSYHKELKQQPALILLLDASASMSIADDATGVTRFNQARQRIEAWWEQLSDDFNLYLIEFSEQATPLADVAQLMELKPDGKATSLSRALSAARGVAKELPAGQVEAAILVSDGIHNSAGKPDEEVRQMGMVVHTVGVGASLRSDLSSRDVQVAGLDCAERLMLNNKAEITASIEGTGLAGRVLEVILEEDGQTLKEEKLTLDEAEGPQNVVFEFRPTVEGRHTYTVRVPPVGDEKIDQNNQRSAVALVVQPGIRVLYLEGTLRPEYGALVGHFLSKDPDLEFCALVQTKANVFSKRSNIEGLPLDAIPSDKETVDQFDVFIIGDLDASYIRPEQQRLLVERIRSGAGLLMLGGYHSLGPGGYAGTPLGEVLPVLLGDRDTGQVTDPFLPQLTPEGVRLPIFANIAEFFPTQTGGPKQEGLPPLLGATRTGPQRPGATVLAVCPLEPALPVLATQPVDKGRTAVFSGDTTRNWHQELRAQDRETPFLQFWGQMVRWLAGRTSEVAIEASIVGSTDKGYYEPEEAIAISAVVRDEQGEGTTEAKVAAVIRGPAGRTDEVALSAVPGPAGHYRGRFEPKTPGSYEIVVQGRLGESTLSSEKLAVEVGRPNLEFERLDLDEKTLGRIAAASGGRCVHISTADQLIEQLDRREKKRGVLLERRLYWPPLFWLLFVGLVTTEWFLRRRFQLR